MPITSLIDRDKRIVYSTCEGVMQEEDFFDYMKEVWYHDNNSGYYELFDTTKADWEDFDYGCLYPVAKKASTLKSLRPGAKLAIIANVNKTKQLTDFYLAAKAMQNVASRSIDVFENKEDALSWLNT